MPLKCLASILCMNTSEPGYHNRLCVLNVDLYQILQGTTDVSLSASHTIPLHGRSIAQAVSHRLPTAEARNRSQVRSRVICNGQIGTAARFLPVLRLPLPILVPPTAPNA
jgi:hypothetical protein